MILRNVTLFPLTILLLLPVSKLLCHSQNMILSLQSTQENFMNKLPQATSCQGCRKLLFYDITTKDLREEKDFSNVVNTLSGDIINTDVKILKGNQELLEVPNSEKFEFSAETNSLTRSFSHVTETFKSLVSLDERDMVDLKETITSNPERFGDSKGAYPTIGLLSEKKGDEDELYLGKPGSKGSTDQNYFEVLADEASRFPKQNKNNLKVSNLKPYTDTLEMDYRSLNNISKAEPYHPQVNTAERETSSSFNVEDLHTGGAKYGPTINIRGETSDINDKKPKMSALIRDNFKVPEMSHLITKPTIDYLQNNEILNSKNLNWRKTSNPRYFNFFGGKHQINKSQKSLKQKDINVTTSMQRDIKSNQQNFLTHGNGIVIESLENSGGVYLTTESSLVVTNVNGIVLEGNLEVSRSVDLTTELPPVATYVNKVIIEGKREVSKTTEVTLTVTNVTNIVIQITTKKGKSNKTLNLDQDKLTKECEEGSGSCLKCREISPYCHYNFRSKLCFYANVLHGNVVYECGVRFFTADGYQPFWIALAALITCSLIVLFFLSRAFYRKTLQKDPITDMEVEDVRNIVHLIKDKRGV